MVGINLNFIVDVKWCLCGLWASRRLGRPKSAIKKLNKKMEILKAKRNDIKRQIKEEERKEKIPTNEVNQWLWDVDKLEDEVANIEQDFQTMRCCSCSCFSCSCFNQIGGRSSQTQEVGDQALIRKSSNCCSIILRVVNKLEDANDLMSPADALDPIVTDLSRLELGIQKLKKEMAILRAKRDDIKKEISDKECEGKIPTNRVSRWLQEVQTLEGQEIGINLDFENISCFSCNNCFNQTGGTSSQTQQAGDQVPFIESSNCCSINRRATEKLGEANDLMSRADALDPIATYPSWLESGIQKLEKEMAKLRAKRDDIKNKITEAEREGKIPTKEVSQWLVEVETLKDQVTDIMQDFQSISCFSCNNCFNQTGGTTSQTQQARDQVPVRESSNCCSINRRATEKLREANELMSRASELDQIVTVGPAEPTAMLPISYQPPVGIDSYVEDIVGYIDSGGESNIIGIYGMGGIGKTTILKSIQQHYFPKHTRFNCVIWVVASKDHKLKKLQMDIAKKLRLDTLKEDDDDETCGKKLFNYLNSRNCLLFLDDIWEDVDLQMLGMAHSATKQGQQQQQSHKVVVFTTRSETVCEQMKAKKIKVECLDPVQAWQLFEENSNKDVLSSDAGIKFVAKELAKECTGLPLALVTVARAMLGIKSWEVWNDTLTQIRDEHKWTSLPKHSLIMYKAFKLSYDSLENDSLRKCFLCCALWPEDYEIDKFKELIPCWIGCGIIRDFNVINEAFAKGCSHLEALVAASLLEKCLPYEDRGVKMHDVIRDMALLMVSGLQGSTRKWIVKKEIEFSDLSKQEEWQEVERASFWEMNDFTFLQDNGAFNFPKLSMLILRGIKGWKRKTILPSLFASMPHLTYLDLAFCRIVELPMEICSLIELQYLNLTRNPITRLPIQFGCLSKLEYLLLRGTNLEIVSNEIISKLSMLKWLDITQMSSANEWWYDVLKNFKGHSHHRLSVEIDIQATPYNIERLNMLTNVSIWKLTLDGLEISERRPNYDLGIPQWGCRTGDKLECLRILNIGLVRLVLAASIGSCLKELQFQGLFHLEEISLNEVRLYNLREICIINCPLLKDVSWVLQLPCLSILSIRYCTGMKELITDVENSNSSSSIQRLSLSLMQNLNRIANRQLHFPFLEYIDVSYCPALKNLSFGVEILKNCRLKHIDGGKKWWDKLDWDDKSIKDSLTPYLRLYDEDDRK